MVLREKFACLDLLGIPIGTNKLGIQTSVQKPGTEAHTFLFADSSTELTMRPQPTEEEIQFILDAIAEYLTVKVRTRSFELLLVWFLGIDCGMPSIKCIHRKGRLFIG